MKKYAFGVDIGGTSVKTGLFETGGLLLESWEIPTRTENNGEAILPDIHEAIAAKLREKRIAIDNVEGIGLGVPGPVSEEGIVLKCVNLGWGIFNVEKAMGQLFNGLRVKAGNDANVAALGEMWQGGGKGFKDIVMVTLGTGVGGGIIIDGKILPGANGSAGEIGHITVSDNEKEQCGCGKCGCLEQYASANGIVFAARRYLTEHPEEKTPLRDVEKLTSVEIFDFAKQGEPVSLKIVNDTCRILGKNLATIACVLNPQAFVIGGGMSKAGDILIDGIKQNYRRYAFHASRETEFYKAKLGNNAGMYGGVKMLISG